MKQLERPESEIVREVLRAVNLIPGVRAWRNNTGAVAAEYRGTKRFIRFGAKGMPDILGWKRTPCVVAGHGVHAILVALECKRPGQRPTTEQAAFLTAVIADGGIGAVVHNAKEAVEALGC